MEFGTIRRFVLSSRWDTGEGNPSRSTDVPLDHHHQSGIYRWRSVAIALGSAPTSGPDMERHPTPGNPYLLVYEGEAGIHGRGGEWWMALSGAGCLHVSRPGPTHNCRLFDHECRHGSVLCHWESYNSRDNNLRIDRVAEWGQGVRPDPAHEQRGTTVTDNLESGGLPRFSRPISIVFGQRPEQGERADRDGAGGLLRPFSGVLEMRAGRGRVPMLDLSYLTLEPLLAATLQGGGDSDPGSGSRGLERVEAPQLAMDETGESGDDDREEPMVKEVIYRDPVGDGAEGGQTGGPGDGGESGAATDMDASSEARSSFGSTFDTTVRRVAAITERTQSGDGRAPAEGSGDQAPSTDQQTEETHHRRLERDASAHSLVGTEPRLSRPRMVTDAASTGVREAAPPGSSSDTPARTTVVDRSVDTGSMERAGGRESGGRDSSRAASGTAVMTRSGIEGTDPDGLDAGDGRGPSVPGHPSERAGDGPRMVVDTSGGESAEATGMRGTASGRATGDSVDPSPGQDPTNRQDGSLDESALVEATRDPDSRLIDRLYRSLKERDAIERRREGRR